MTCVQTTANVRAGANVRPYRAVTVSAENTVTEGTVGSFIIGVSDGSSSEFDTANHARTGELVRLQQGDIVKVTAFGAVTRGADLESTISGTVRAWTATGQHFGIALESAGASGDVIRCLFQPTFKI